MRGIRKDTDKIIPCPICKLNNDVIRYGQSGTVKQIQRYWCKRCKKSFKEIYKKFLDYNKAQKIVQNLRIKSRSHYYKLCKEGRLPKGLPKSPQDVYGVRS